MKTKLLSFWLTSLMMLVSQSLFAYDFESDGIYYNITSSEKLTVEVTSGSSYSGSVTIPATVTYSGTTYSVTSIGSYAFKGCSGLTSITIPNSVISIGEYAFKGCSGLTSITIPNSVTSIGSNAFWDCRGLTSVTIPNSVTSIGEYAFYGCYKLKSVTIPDSVTSIGGSAFWGCSGLTSITIPNSVTSIGSSAFKDCSGLTSVTIPNSVTSIGNYAFSGCSGLTSLTIPNSVTSVGSSAFSGCKLRDIQILAETPPSIGSNTFSGQSLYHTTLLVPVGCWDKYAYDNTYWYQFINIKENASATKELNKTQAYALKNVADRSYLVYDPVNDAVATIELDANVNESDPNQSWQFIEQDGATYIYNLGAQKYLAPKSSSAASLRRMAAAATSTSWTLSSTPVALSLKDGSNGVNIGNSGAWMFVLNETLAVSQNVTGIESLATEAIDAPAYDLQGRQAKGTGLQILKGKKILKKL